jgi:hypothetical protein
MEPPCCLMIIADYTTQYIGDHNTPRTGNHDKPARIQWNDRGILNTAHLISQNDIIIHFGYHNL